MKKRNKLISKAGFYYYNLLAFITKGNKRFVDKKLLFGALIVGLSQYGCKPKTQDIHTDVKDKDSNHNGIITCYEEIPLKNTDSSKNKKSIPVKTKKEKIATTTMCYGVVDEPTCYVVAMPKPDDYDIDTLYTNAEIMPEFPGGEDSLMSFLHRNIIFPENARKKDIEGTTVYTSFIVECDGSITNLKIIRGIGNGFDEEILRVIKLMPKWIPGKQNGKTVRVQFNLPIRFEFQ